MINNIKQFSWICSGAHIKTLKECPSEGSKYAGIGATIFFTGLFAIVSASYALFTVFDSVWLALGLGLVWGLMIFNLDRYIVSSMKKYDNWKKELFMATPRILLALLISIVIAKPLELKIFEKEINAEIGLMQEEELKKQNEAVLSRYTGPKAVLNSEIVTLKAEIASKELKRDELRKVARREADGTGGTMKRNPGPIYKIKKAEADRMEQELEDLTLTNNSLINGALLRIDSLDQMATASINGLSEIQLTGMASRLEALSRIEENSSAIWWASWFIIILFIAIETAPVFVKLISNRGPYDDLVAVIDHRFESLKIKEMAATSAKTKKQSAGMPNKERSYVDERMNLGLEKG